MMKEEAHIKAMRRGIQKIFSQNLWDTGVPAKNGWERLGDVKAIEKIETETVTVVETDPPSEEKIYPTKDEIWDYLNSSPNGHRAGEFAIGTNTSVTKLSGNLLQDEKIPGIHVAFGNPYPDRTGADWTSGVHVDVVPTLCTITIDDKILMKDGIFAF